MVKHQLVCCVLGNVLQDEEHFYISLPLFIMYTSLSILGILFAIICLVFELSFRNQKYVYIIKLLYHIAGKFGGRKFDKFSQSSVIHQTYNYYLLAESIRLPNFSHTKLSCYAIAS